jgi:hypothetical protein
VATLLNRAVWNLQRHERLTVGSRGGHEVEVAADLSYDRSGRSITHFNWRLKADDGVSITTTFTPNTDRNRVEMGTVIRLEHMVSSIPAAIGRCHTRIGELEHTITQSERLVDRPFQHTQALIDARAHYADLSKRMAEIQEQQPEIDAATAGFETVAVGTSSGAQMQRAAPATTGPAVRLGPSI